MSNLRQAAQQALDYWEQVTWGDVVMEDKMHDLRVALSESAQRPVYWEVRCESHPKWMRVDEQQFYEYVTHGWDGQKLYTSRQRSEPEALAQEQAEINALERFKESGGHEEPDPTAPRTPE